MMKLATTTGDFGFYTKDYVEQIKHIKEAGFKYIDLSLYSPAPNDPLFSDDWKREAARIKNYMNENGLQFVQSHGFNCNCLGGEEKYKEAVAKTIRCIEICAELGIPNTVVHSGFSKEVTDKDEWFEKNRAFVKELIPIMEETGVEVLCENSTKANMGECYFINNGKDTREFVDFVDHPLFAACWDTGHANDEGPQYDDIIALGEAMHAIHFNDNRGEKDDHLVPYMGTMNSDEVINALIDIDFKGALTFESGALHGSKYWLGKRRKFERDTRLLEPTLAMHKKLEELLYTVGVHILTSYDLFEG